MGFVIVGATLQASAFTVAHLIIGRVITGLGTGIDSSTVPMYQSELCEKEHRGRLVSWEVLFIGVGIVLAVGLTLNWCHYTQTDLLFSVLDRFRLPVPARFRRMAHPNRHPAHLRNRGNIPRIRFARKP